MDSSRHDFRTTDLDKKFDFNWLLANQKLSLTTKVHGFSSGSFIRCLGRFGFGAIRALAYSIKPSSLEQGCIAFFTSSKNQLLALNPVVEQLDNACIVEMVAPSNKSANALFPLHKAYLRAIPALIALGCNYHKHNDFQKSVIKSRGDLLALAPSLESVAIQFLQTRKPVMVVVSNDTVLWGRAILSAARFLEIPTALLQHAPVSKMVPPLDVDYAFLDGLDAATKYQEAGINPKCHVYFSGGPRHDELLLGLDESVKSAGNMKDTLATRVGICTNAVDDFHKTEELIKQILQFSSVASISLRCHPQDKRKSRFSGLALSAGINYSANDKESPKQFIDNVDLIIAGDSSMLLDAVLSRKTAIRSSLLGIYPDFLGLVDAGIVARAENANELKLFIQHSKHPKEQNLEALRRYCATIDTSWQGQSGKLVADTLNDILNNTLTDSTTWKSGNRPRQWVLKSDAPKVAKI